MPSVDESTRKSWDFVGGVMACVASVFAFIMFMPNKIDRGPDPKVACIANLKMIDGAKCSWALENHKTNNDVVTDTDLFGIDKYIREKPVCPSAGTYLIGAIIEKPHCSISAHTL